MWIRTNSVSRCTLWGNTLTEAYTNILGYLKWRQCWYHDWAYSYWQKNAFERRPTVQAITVVTALLKAEQQVCKQSKPKRNTWLPHIHYAIINCCTTSHIVLFHCWTHVHSVNKRGCYRPCLERDTVGSPLTSLRVMTFTLFCNLATCVSSWWLSLTGSQWWRWVGATVCPQTVTSPRSLWAGPPRTWMTSA